MGEPNSQASEDLLKEQEQHAPESREDVKARVEDHLARYRKRNGLPPPRPPLKRPKPN